MSARRIRVLACSSYGAIIGSKLAAKDFLIATVSIFSNLMHAYIQEPLRESKPGEERQRGVDQLIFIIRSGYN